ncbi:amino acid ABC transporter ATP-binding protein [Phreatobacter stygius]|uniref:Amino acid ABC transporter ATP-binding protein n=1 Tax=Phreatobacter stygius TaxID=1940610 RepID=A0A4D7B8C9_9HYPH|nr:amino acid ABC transporter ATP-binding protein [Phreatobacter stygius]QCI67103.1 amino acid ABC transporter ATP-binding protein [Phreatobacter stygius]
MATENAMPAPTALVRAQNVQKWFGSHQVLKGVDLSVERGQVMSIIGPSGSGKSTFLRCINQLETYQAGRIYVGDALIGFEEARDGKLVALSNRRIVAQRRRIGMVFQQFNLFWHMTVLENIIEAPVLVLGQPRHQAERKAMELLERVGLAEKANAFPSKLSGGQQQRAAIARALAMNPELMLFDEPTSALDPETTGEVLSVIAELASSGMTMIIVTHEMSFARQVSDRVMLMENGMVDYGGPPEQFFGAQPSPRLKAFLSTIH